MRKSITTLAIIGMLAGFAHADDPTNQPTAQLQRGLRMKLVPPAPPKPAAGEGDDPLAEITNQMTDIVGELAQLKTDHPVQEKQKQVVSQLDAIIAELEQQCKNGKAGGGRNPTKPLADSVIAGGPGGMGDLINPTSGTRNINTLPPKQREAILQSKTEGFPPGYESLLQSYYQRLAQEKMGDEPTDKNPSKPAGAIDSTTPAPKPAAP